MNWVASRGERAPAGHGGRGPAGCHVSGAADAPALVLLHGLGDDASTWDVVGAEFARHFRVLAIDQRGHGLSDRPGAYSFELMRDDVLGVLDQLGLDRVNLLGHSMGGTVARPAEFTAAVLGFLRGWPRARQARPWPPPKSSLGHGPPCRL